ncbi:nuclear pore complex protein Nup98-Nup96 [Eupeodes corollae]|uniref:nuclear pore complex protein Nup98-Nup96 n=1 Tax=Eupeodes corollae TaxID=290404 RepID=UPI0024913626|nr:nuclear pore complex protein Nup98-Nup96 [Eupeodes corollae]
MLHIGQNRKKLAVLLALLLGSQLCIAQTGYNYPRPEVPLGNSAPGISSTSSGSSVRPVVGFPTAATGAGFSPSPSYGGSVGPTAPSFGFSPAQRTASAFGSTGTAFGSNRATSDITTTGFPNTSGIGKRPTIPPRSGGIYGSGSSGLGSQQQQQQQYSSGDQFEGDYSAIPGEPGVNYPVYAEVPPTSFDCNQQQYPGYYSDVEAQCQVFHICALNRTYSFLCPNGTIFSQETLVCVWWNMFDCALSPGLYSNNAFIYDYLQPTEARPATGGSYSGGGLTNSNRAQSGFQGSGRTSAATGGGGVFSGNVRPTVPNASFGGVTSGVTPVGTTAFPSGASGTGRFSGTGNAPTGGAFPTGPPATAPAFGTTIRTGFTPIQDATFPSPQVSPTTTNREYLPPRRP